MNANVLKPQMPFIAKGELSRTPATEENKKMVEYIDSHNFSFFVDEDTEELKTVITEK